MHEKTALITASDKLHVPDLAEALDEAGFKIVSLGNTAELIEDQTSVRVTHTEALMRHIVDLEDLDGLPARARREIMSGYIGQCLALRPDRLERMEWPVIDFVYVNLMRPERVEDEKRSYDWLRVDKGGQFLIESAVEGRRMVLMEPEQIDGFISDLNSEDPPVPQTVKNRELSNASLEKLQLYLHLANVNLGNLATTEMRLPRLSQPE